MHTNPPLKMKTPPPYLKIIKDEGVNNIVKTKVNRLLYSEGIKPLQGNIRGNATNCKGRLVVAGAVAKVDGSGSFPCQGNLHRSA